VTATVANTGEVAGTTNVSLAMDGETYEAQSVAVGPRSSATATFSLPVEAVGEHTLTAGDASGTLSVAVQETATATTEEASATTTATDGDATRRDQFRRRDRCGGPYSCSSESSGLR